MVVVLPTPFTPTTMITKGWPVLPARSSTAIEPDLLSSSRPAISSRRMRSSSPVLTYLSRATRASMRSMTLTVVSMPTSACTSRLSRSSSTASSTVLLPTTALLSCSKKLVLVFSRPGIKRSLLGGGFLVLFKKIEEAHGGTVMRVARA